jgi:hypothetical protein
MTPACTIIAAKSHSARWNGKNARLLPGVLAAVPSWAPAIVATDCDTIDVIARNNGATVIRRDDWNDTAEPVSVVWRRVARELDLGIGSYVFCPLANVIDLTVDVWHYARSLLDSGCQQVNAFTGSAIGKEAGFFACDAKVLLFGMPIAAYVGAVMCCARELHHVEEMSE